MRAAAADLALKIPPPQRLIRRATVPDDLLAAAKGRKDESHPSPSPPPRRKSAAKGSDGVTLRRPSVAPALLEHLRTDDHMRVVLDEWHAFLTAGGRDPMVSKSVYLHMLTKSYKVIGTADGKILHPTSDNAQQQAADDWANLKKARTDSLSRAQLEDALISRTVPWLQNREIEASPQSCAGVLDLLLSSIAAWHEQRAAVCGTPLRDNGEPARCRTDTNIADSGRWLSVGDTICPASAEALQALLGDPAAGLVNPPLRLGRGGEALKHMLTEVLGGSRCRAVPPMAAAEIAYPAFRRPLHSFSNATRAAAAQPDWRVIKGFAVYQCGHAGIPPKTAV